MTSPAFGITWVVDSMHGLGPLMAACEEAGFSFIGVPDSHASTYRDLYVAMTVALSHTRDALVISLVTNPVTRHPAVTANATATLGELSGNRAAIGIGSGDSALMTLGYRPARMRDTEEYVAALRGLLAGEEVTYQGRPCQPAWFAGGAPIYIGAVGPKMLELGGRIGDGVVTNTGVSPEIVHSVSGHVADGARAAGKDPADVPVWWVVRTGIEDTHEEALRMVAPSVAAGANSSFKLGYEGKHMPEELQGAMTTLMERYAYRDHSRRADNNQNAALMEELGLLDYLSGRFAVAGTPDECAEQIEHFVGLGAHNLLLRPQTRDRLAFVRRWRDEVVPALARRGLVPAPASRQG